MTSQVDSFHAHLKTGLTTVCHAWCLKRRDGTQLGFTDHDRNLSFDGIEFRADTGLSALTVQQTSGLSIDNTEAVGALSDLSITEADIAAGLFDGAEVLSWKVNWTDVAQRKLQFRGAIGEIRRSSGAFVAELRGLAEALNTVQGRIYQKGCGAILGDKRCGFDLETPGYWDERAIETAEEGRVFDFEEFLGFDDNWFQRGLLKVLTGDAAGQSGIIKRDTLTGSARQIELWQPLRGELRVGDMIRLIAGCDKRVQTCAAKFDNILNFQGFPFLPGEDWLSAVPRSSGDNSGGSLVG